MDNTAQSGGGGAQGGIMVEINLASQAQAVEKIIAAARRAESFDIFTLNLDHMLKLRRDEKFRMAYKNADMVSADGWPIIWLARLKGARISRATGADMVVPLCAEAAQENVPVALFGSSDESLRAAAAHLRQQAPGLSIVFIKSPPMGFEPGSPEAEQELKRIEASGARLCFLALGAPKQELLAARARTMGIKCGFVCIGAALDFLAGSQKRAPQWMRRAGLEWFYRLASNPRRLAARYAGSALILAESLVRQLIGAPDAKCDFSIGEQVK
jgi:exopolysaccharide biosynthesis WecB/TagA/CpsF family protein